MREIAAVAAGGAIGALVRWGIGVWMAGRGSSAFPWHTMLVNISGAFLVGVLMALSLEKGLVSGDWRLFLGTGVLGGFTTFSTLSYESIGLIQDGLWMQGLTNMFATAVAGLVAAWLGFVAARVL